MNAPSDRGSFCLRTFHNRTLTQTMDENANTPTSTPPSTPTPTHSATHSPSTPISNIPFKVLLLFKAIGSAPELKQKKFKLDSTATIAQILEFLKKQLHYKPEDTLFLFINSAFQPSLDESVGDLYKCFQVGEKLVINYSTTQAYG